MDNARMALASSLRLGMNLPGVEGGPEGAARAFSPNRCGLSRKKYPGTDWPGYPSITNLRTDQFAQIA
jgi:hypothetical protein